MQVKIAGNEKFVLDTKKEIFKISEGLSQEFSQKIHVLN
jgi:hypothetical protein